MFLHFGQRQSPNDEQFFRCSTEQENMHGARKITPSSSTFINVKEGWKHITGLLSMEEEEELIDKWELQINTTRDNIKVIRRADHWRNLVLKESLAIKERKPSLNNGIKAVKDLCLF